MKQTPRYQYGRGPLALSVSLGAAVDTAMQRFRIQFP